MRNNPNHIQVIPCNPEAIDSLRQDSLGDDAPVVMILPRHQTTVRLVEFPTHDPVEVAQMAELSAGEMVPFSSEERILSSAIVQKLPDGKSQVLIAVAHREVVEEYLQQLQTTGREAQALYLSTACLVAAIECFNHPSNDSPRAYVHIGSDSLDIIVVEDGVLRSSHGAEINSDAPAQIVSAIEDALRSYTRANTPVEVYVSAALPLSKDFCSACVTQLPGCLAKNISPENDLLSQGARSLTHNDPAQVINLLPKSIQDHRIQQQVKRSLLKQCALFAFMLLLIVATFAQAIVQQQDYLVQLEDEASNLRPVAQAVMQKRSHLKRLQEQVTRSDTPYQHLGRIMAQTPKGGLTFSRFSYDHVEGITLYGRADSRERFDTLIDQLRMVGKTVYPQFAQAQSIYDRQRKEHNLDVWEYAISIDFPSLETQDLGDDGGAHE